jgi:photosystem II stability/assembly factor-like uncharacterized protein
MRYRWGLQKSKSTNDFFGASFINENVGWVVGNNNSTILKTTDGGNSWIILDCQVKSNLKSVYFVNENVGWVVGEGVIINTTDGGLTWNIYTDFPQQYNTTFHSVRFTNEMSGWIIEMCSSIPYNKRGTNWNLVTNLPDTYPLYSLTSMFFLDNNTFLDPERRAILHTTDGGSTGLPVKLIAKHT